MDYRYRVENDTETYRGFFRVRRYTVAYERYRGGMGEPVERECLGRAGSAVVAALPYDPERGELIFVEQFRIGAMVAGFNPWQREIVAGFMDEKDTTPEAAIQRELEEEIGTRARRLEYIAGYFGSPGGSAGRVHLYLAAIDSSQTVAYSGIAAEGEDIAVHRLSYREALDWLAAGKLDNANTLIAMQAFLLRHPHLAAQQHSQATL